VITAWIVAICTLAGIAAGIVRLIFLTGRLVQRVDDMDERLKNLERRPKARTSRA